MAREPPCLEPARDLLHLRPGTQLHAEALEPGGAVAGDQVIDHRRLGVPGVPQPDDAVHAQRVAGPKQGAQAIAHARHLRAEEAGRLGGHQRPVALGGPHPRRFDAAQQGGQARRGRDDARGLR